MHNSLIQRFVHSRTTTPLDPDPLVCQALAPSRTRRTPFCMIDLLVGALLRNGSYCAAMRNSVLLRSWLRQRKGKEYWLLINPVRSNYDVILELLSVVYLYPEIFVLYITEGSLLRVHKGDQSAMRSNRSKDIPFQRSREDFSWIWRQVYFPFVCSRH